MIKECVKDFVSSRTDKVQNFEYIMYTVSLPQRDHQPNSNSSKHKDKLLLSILQKIANKLKKLRYLHKIAEPMNNIQKAIMLVLLLIISINVYYTLNIPKGNNVLNKPNFLTILNDNKKVSTKLGNFELELIDYTTSLSDRKDIIARKHKLKIRLTDENNKTVYDIEKITLPKIQAANPTKVIDPKFEKDIFDTYLVFDTPLWGARYGSIVDENGTQVNILFNPLLKIVSYHLFVPLLFVLAAFDIYYRGTFELFSVLLVCLIINYVTSDMIWGTVLFLFVLTLMIRFKIAYTKIKVNQYIQGIVGIGVFCSIMTAIFYFDFVDTTIKGVALALVYSILGAVLTRYSFQSLTNTYHYLCVFLCYPEQKITEITATNFKSTRGRYASYYVTITLNNQHTLEQVEVSYTTYTRLKESPQTAATRYKSDNKSSFVLYN